MAPLPIPTAAAPAPLSPSLEWRQSEDLPDPVGLKGMYAGVSDGCVVLAGGSNFPVPLHAGGRKVFHRTIYVRPLPIAEGDGWTTAGDALPVGLAEGAAVTTEHGVVCVGGHDGEKPIAAAFVLKWNSRTRAIERRALPDLPAGIANPAAVYWRGSVYVTGGESSGGPVGTFWRLDLARALAEPATTRWEILAGWPGRPRFGSILAAITTSAGERLLVAGGMHGPARSQADYLRDAFLYDPETRGWSRAAPMPRGAVLGGVVHAGTSTSLMGPSGSTPVLVLGGSDGHDFERMKELGERYRIPSDILMYDALKDRWATVGTMPLGVVGAAVVGLGHGGWLVAGGEYSPGLRTAQVFELSIKNKE